MSSTSLVRCKLWNLFPLLTPDVSISPHSPHPRYNELDWVSRLQTHLCPNRLSGLEALCEGPGTNLLPFSRAWEVCKKSDRSAVSALWSDLLANTMQTPFLHKDAELGDTTVRPVTGPGVMGERCIPAQGFSNHVLAQGQLSSAQGEMEGRRRKIYWLQLWENFQTFMPRQHNE